MATAITGLRIPKDVKNTIKSAAKAQGYASLTAFMVEASLNKAKSTPLDSRNDLTIRDRLSLVVGDKEADRLIMKYGKDSIALKKYL